MKKNTDDASIYEGLIRRDLDALAAMFDVYEEPMYLLIKKYAALASEEEIANCVGECLIGIWDNIEEFDLKGQRFERWVGKLTYRKAMNLQNKLAKQKKSSVARVNYLIWDEKKKIR